jgi:hypothetical protein
MTIPGHAMLRAMLFGAGLTLALPAWAADAPATSAGPGRIVCHSATSCTVSIGTAAAMHYHIDATALPKSDKDRLKTCTAKAKPCVATVDGTEMNDPLKIKASKITFYN